MENLNLDNVGAAFCQDSGDGCPTLQGDCIHIKDETLKSVQDYKWFAWNTWCLAICKNLATNFDRFKFKKRVLEMGDWILYLTHDVEVFEGGP